MLVLTLLVLIFCRSYFMSRFLCCLSLTSEYDYCYAPNILLDTEIFLAIAIEFEQLTSSGL